MVEPFYSTIQQYGDNFLFTDIPPECWMTSSGVPCGCRIATRATYGALSVHCSAHFRERVYPTYGSGMFFNAYRDLEFGREQKTLIKDGHAYICEGVYHWVSGRNGFACAITPGRIRLIVFSKTSGSTNFRIQWANFMEWVVTTSGSKSGLSEGTDYVGSYSRAKSSYPWPEIAVSGKNFFSDAWSRRPSGFDNLPLGGNGSPSSKYSIDEAPKELEGLQYFDFRDNEYNKFLWIKETGIVMPPYASMASQAYYQAVSSFPAVHSNTIANILEILDLGRSLVNGGIIRKLTSSRNVKAVKDAWLAYRYGYSTSKSDIEEIFALQRRLDNLPVGDITLRGSVHFSHTIVKCAVKLPMSDITRGIEDPFSFSGIKLTPQNIWDLVPYSFVVDWFLRISDWLDYFETQQFSLSLHPKEVWYSIRTAYNNQTTYFRWQGTPALGLPFDLYAPVSNRTVAMRIGDVLALS